jgi:hypothetical protein
LFNGGQDLRYVVQGVSPLTLAIIGGNLPERPSCCLGGAYDEYGPKLPVREQENPGEDAKEMTAGVADVEVFFLENLVAVLRADLD